MATEGGKASREDTVLVWQDSAFLVELLHFFPLQIPSGFNHVDPCLGVASWIIVSGLWILILMPNISIKIAVMWGVAFLDPIKYL